MAAPTGIFRYRDDEFIALMILPHQWTQIVAALEMPELATDPRFNSPRARRDNNTALRDVIEAWLTQFPTRDAALAALERHRVPCAPVLTVAEAMAHPHMRERGTIRTVDDPHLGRFDIPGPPARFSAWPTPTNLKADLLGEHNESILAELAGLSAGEIKALYAEGVLVRDAALEGTQAP